MSELEEKLSKILSSPEDMEKIAGLAKSLSGSLNPPDGGGDAARDGGDGLSGLLGGLDPKMLKVLGRLTGEFSSGGDKADLLRAIRPYLKDDRREKLDRAADAARLARIAKLAMTEFSGGGSDV